MKSASSKQNPVHSNPSNPESTGRFCVAASLACLRNLSGLKFTAVSSPAEGSIPASLEDIDMATRMSSVTAEMVVVVIVVAEMYRPEVLLASC